MRNESVFWGIVLVLLGGLLLMDNMGLLPPNINIWSLFWPIILVGIGVRMLLRSSGRGGYFSGGDPRGIDSHSPMTGTSAAPVTGERITTTPSRAEAYRLPLEGARSARVRLRHGAGELRIDDQATPDELLSGAFTGGVDPKVSRDGEQLIVDLGVPSNTFPVVFDSSSPLNWAVGFNPNVPLWLELEVGASRNRLNLSNLQVKDLRLETGASESEIEMPARAGQTFARLKSGMARVEVRVPEGVSARIHTGSALSSIDVDTARFPRVGNNDFMSPDYEVSGNRLDLEIESGMGAVQVR